MASISTETRTPFTGLAEKVNDEVERLLGKPGSTSARVVRRWLSGEVAWPREHSRRALEALFGRSALDLGNRPCFVVTSSLG
ncbi:hypothetical protein CAG99_03215 [Streptomyces marincola]|uniref:Uncharacterized protein n=1 Tax=Streptomyces marincola TaxID=2878388 RepID=A0A1W7CT36_9ACTN|nr:hypothetical protein CAG99_03215 [Streptomyces marincola]